jgi:mono/diheme cytochrome c family protein
VKLGVLNFGAFTRALALLLLLIAGSVQLVWAADDDDSESGGAKFSAEAAATFNKRCTACHTFGKGVKVGPDLKDVTKRRGREWLIKFIHASSTVINSGDATAVSLFAEFKKQRMPDWTDLSEKQINDILDFIAIGGPDIKPPDERNAELASSSDLELGRQLFSGARHFKYGVQPCGACHSVQGTRWGGSLGPDLTQTYFKFQDRALTEFLRHPCFRWESAGAGAHYLTAKEVFALKAFLRQAGSRKSAQVESPGRAFSSASAQQAILGATQAALLRQGDRRKGSAR